MRRQHFQRHHHPVKTPLGFHAGKLQAEDSTGGTAAQAGIKSKIALKVSVGLSPRIW
jgi:hypothetical protein